MDKTKLASEPIFFERNRVFRVYTGGKQYASLMNDPPEDNMFPEEWIASGVKAINPRYFGPRDGVSRVRGTDIFFDDFLKEEKE
ncbi:MAG TPA: mannose-6-phosphate isomerase, partial [Clostridia bacterium]|nr:mannose-6-phosphate isomerase [Clostridia bacterium]